MNSKYKYKIIDDFFFTYIDIRNVTYCRNLSSGKPPYLHKVLINVFEEQRSSPEESEKYGTKI